MYVYKTPKFYASARDRYARIKSREKHDEKFVSQTQETTMAKALVYPKVW